jgi:hypothetical protein
MRVIHCDSSTARYSKGVDVSDRFTEHQRQTLEQLATLFTVPDIDTEELDTVYLQIIADQLIQVADAGFQREGRGVVLVDVPDAALPERPDEVVRSYYLSQAKARSSELIWSGPTIAEVLQAYNPRVETLVCLTHAPKASFYRIKRRKRTTQHPAETDSNRAGGGAPAVSVRVSRIPT